MLNGNPSDARREESWNQSGSRETERALGSGVYIARIVRETAGEFKKVNPDG